jgi:transcriptional regulator with XRE-family HTH domain
MATMGRRRREESPHRDASRLLSERVQKRRLERGWSQQRLAQEAEVSMGTIRKIETQAVADPGVFTVAAIANALGVAVDRLIEQPGSQTEQT